MSDVKSKDEESLREALQEELACPVCMEAMEDPRMLPCAHTFCFNCVAAMQTAKAAAVAAGSAPQLPCPSCGAVCTVSVELLPRNFALINLMELVGLTSVPRKTAAPTTVDSGTPRVPPIAKPATSTICAAHPGQIVRHFCKQCHQALCQACMPPHAAHQTVLLAAAASDAVHDLQAQLGPLRGTQRKLQHLADQLRDTVAHAQVVEQVASRVVQTRCYDLQHVLADKATELSTAAAAVTARKVASLRDAIQRLDECDSAVSAAVSMINDTLTHSDVEVLTVRETILSGVDSATALATAVLRDGDVQAIKPVTIVGAEAVEASIKQLEVLETSSRPALAKAQSTSQTVRSLPDAVLYNLFVVSSGAACVTSSTPGFYQVGQKGFPSIVGRGCPVSRGKWYFEVRVLTGGLVQIGWVTNKFAGNSRAGHGVGDDATSWACDGHRKLRWHANSSTAFGSGWMASDVVGCALDLDAGVMSFSLNGSFNAPWGVAFNVPTTGETMYYPGLTPAASEQVQLLVPDTAWNFRPPTPEYRSLVQALDILSVLGQLATLIQETQLASDCAVVSDWHFDVAVNAGVYHGGLCVRNEGAGYAILNKGLTARQPRTAITFQLLEDFKDDECVCFGLFTKPVNREGDYAHNASMYLWRAYNGALYSGGTAVSGTAPKLHPGDMATLILDAGARTMAVSVNGGPVHPAISNLPAGATFFPGVYMYGRGNGNARVRFVSAVSVDGAGTPAVGPPAPLAAGLPAVFEGISHSDVKVDDTSIVAANCMRQSCVVLGTAVTGRMLVTWQLLQDVLDNETVCFGATTLPVHSNGKYNTSTSCRLLRAYNGETWQHGTRQSREGPKVHPLDYVSILFDMDRGTMTYYVNGAEAGELFAGVRESPLYPCVSTYQEGRSTAFRLVSMMNAPPRVLNIGRSLEYSVTARFDPTTTVGASVSCDAYGQIARLGSNGTILLNRALPEGGRYTVSFQLIADHASDQVICFGLSRRPSDGLEYDKSTTSIMYRCYNGVVYKFGTAGGQGAAVKPGSVMTIICDFVAHTVEFAVDGTKVPFVVSAVTGDLYPTVHSYLKSGSRMCCVRFLGIACLE